MELDMEMGEEKEEDDEKRLTASSRSCSSCPIAKYSNCDSPSTAIESPSSVDHHGAGSQKNEAEINEAEVVNGGNRQRRWSRKDSVGKAGGKAASFSTFSTLGQSDSSEERSDSFNVVATQLDWVAISACFCCRFCFIAIYSYLMALATPFQMASFGWTGEQMVSYGMIVQGITGTMGLLICFAFTFRGLQRWLAQERLQLLFCLGLLLAFFVITFQWPFLDQRMPNCDVANHLWCEDMPATNVYVYNAAYIICIGLALPIGFQNLDVLYSRLLGPIKQGTMQGIYAASGNAVSLVGPSLINFIYQYKGPQPVWIGYMLFYGIGNGVWLLAYRRLVPSSEKERGITASASLAA